MTEAEALRSVCPSGTAFSQETSAALRLAWRAMELWLFYRPDIYGPAPPRIRPRLVRCMWCGGAL